MSEFRQHILVIHRWRDHYARYADYIDHNRNDISYITTKEGAQSVPHSAVDVAVVPATDDISLVGPAAARLSARHGVPNRVVALNEGDLDTAAELRRRIHCPGQQPSELAPFRDKLVMLTRVARAGIRVPAFADAPDRQAVAAFARQHGWPVIVKPRRGTASRNVVRLDGESDLDRYDQMAAEARLVQTFLADPIYHVDGLWTGSRLGPWRASRYINSCAGFTTGSFLGSVEVDDSHLLPHLDEITAAMAGALSAEPWVFHLEVFVGAHDGAPRITFLEAGARVGGAEIPFIWREVHGVDLMAAAFDVQLGRPPQLPVVGERWSTGGWLLVPTPIPSPCRVVEARLSTVPGCGPYMQVLPEAGDLIPRLGGYEHVGGRFRFRGMSSKDVENAILGTASNIRIRCEPIEISALTVASHSSGRRTA